jgi:hypothetical protein
VTLFPLEYHIVLNLESVILHLLSATVTLECGALKIKLKGSQISNLAPFGTEIAAGGHFEASTGSCTGKKPAFTEYDNMLTSMSSAKLESSVGLGFEEACEEVEGKIKLTASTMLEGMEP